MTTLAVCFALGVFTLSSCGGSSKRNPHNSTTPDGGGTSATAGSTSNGFAGDDPSAGGDDAASALAGAAGGTYLAGAPSMGGAGGEPPLAGGSGGRGGDAAGGSNAACTGFVDLWRVRQGERAPGDIAPPVGELAPCFECISAAAQSCGLPADGACAGGYACVERHCLCTPDADLGQTCLASDYPTDVCTCADGCYPVDNANRECRSRWRLYLACVVETCGSQCTQ